MRSFFIFLLAFIFAFNSSGQSREAFNSMERIAHQGLRIIEEQQISGNPYLDREFKPALIVRTDDSEITNMSLRYNIFKNIMEFKQKETLLYIADPITIDHIILDNNVFVYAPYKASKKIKRSYFQLIASGNFQLLKKYNSVLKKSDPKEGTPTRFEDSKPDYYLRYKDGTAKQITTRKELIKIIQPISKEIIDYIQQQKIKVYDETELISTIKYINKSTD